MRAWPDTLASPPRSLQGSGTAPCFAMNDTDTAQVMVRPPLAWALAIVAGLALNWLLPLRFLPAALPAKAIGAIVFLAALMLFVFAIMTISRAGSNVPTNRPTTMI